MKFDIDITDMKDSLKRSSSAYMHSLIHQIHDQSEFLVDDEMYNDDEALKKLEIQLQELFKVFGIRMNCR